jgi:hypothetical protein
MVERIAKLCEQKFCQFLHLRLLTYHAELIDVDARSQAKAFLTFFVCGTRRGGELWFEINRVKPCLVLLNVFLHQLLPSWWALLFMPCPSQQRLQKMAQFVAKLIKFK